MKRFAAKAYISLLSAVVIGEAAMAAMFGNTDNLPW